MSLEDHIKPDGNYDGVGAMAEVTGLPRDEIRAIAAAVKANHVRLDSCPWHEFEAIPQSGITARLSDRYRCRHCQGEVDAVAYSWHQKGRRPMPVGEPQAYSFTPVPGATCSRELAAAGKPYPRTCQVHGLTCGVKP